MSLDDDLRMARGKAAQALAEVPPRPDALPGAPRWTVTVRLEKDGRWYSRSSGAPLRPGESFGQATNSVAVEAMIQLLACVADLNEQEAKG